MKIDNTTVNSDNGKVVVSMCYVVAILNLFVLLMEDEKKYIDIS